MIDDELSAAVAKRVMGWMLYDGAWGRPGTGTVHANASDWRAATDWRAAGEVVEAMGRLGWSFGVVHHRDGTVDVRAWTEGCEKEVMQCGLIFPRAVCEVTLAALEA